MSEKKSGLKTVTLRNDEALHFYQILSNKKYCPLRDIGEMARMTRILNVLDSHVMNYTVEIGKLEKSYSTTETDKTTGIKSVLIPVENYEKYQKEKEKLDSTTKEYSFDREALVWARDLYTSVPKRMYREGSDNTPAQGMGGYQDAKLFSGVNEAIG